MIDGEGFDTDERLPHVNSLLPAANLVRSSKIDRSTRPVVTELRTRTQQACRAVLIVLGALVVQIRPAWAQCSLICTPIVAQDAVQKSGFDRSKELQKIFNEAPVSNDFADQLNAHLSKAAESYQQYAKIANQKKDDYNRARQMNAFESDVQMPLASTVGLFTDFQYEQASEQLQGVMRSEQSKLASVAVYDLRQMDAELFTQMAAASPEERARLFSDRANQSAKIRDTKLFKDSPPETQVSLLGLDVDLVNRLFEDELKQSATRDRVQQTDIDKHSQQLAAQGKAIGDLKNTVDKNLAQIRNAQDAQARAIDTLSLAVQDNAASLSFVADVTFSNLSPSRQLQLLQSPQGRLFLRGLDDSARTKVIADIKHAAALQDMNTALQNGQTVINGFKVLAKAPGLEGLAEPLKTAEQAVAVGRLISAAMSPNPIEIFAALGQAGGLFPGGGDPNAGLMSGIASIRQDIQEMRNEMRQQHQETMEGLQTISNQIDARYAVLAKQGEQAFDLSSWIEKGVIEGLSADLAQCDTVRELWDNDFDAAQEYLNGYSQGIAACYQGIMQRLSSQKLALPGNGVSTVFFLGLSDAQETNLAYEESIRRAITFRRSVLRPTVAYFRRYVFKGQDLGKCSPLDAAYVTLIADMSSVEMGSSASRLTQHDCVEQQQRYELYSESAHQKLYINPLAAATDLLSVNQVVHYVYTIYAIAPLWEFLDHPSDANPKVRAISKVWAKPSTPTVAARTLGYSLDLVNLGIVQQNLLAGNPMIDDMVDRLEAGRKLSAEDFKSYPEESWSTCDASSATGSSDMVDYVNTLCLLRKNPVLQRNVMTRWVRSRFNGPLSADVSYRMGLDATQSDILLQAAFTAQMPITRGNCGGPEPLDWCLEFLGPVLPANGDLPAEDGRFLFPAPPWEMAATGHAVYWTTEYSDLVALRDRLVDRLLAVKLSQRIKDKRMQGLLYAGVLSSQSIRSQQTTDP